MCVEKGILLMDEGLSYWKASKNNTQNNLQAALWMKVWIVGLSAEGLKLCQLCMTA